jgi:hypothetical protein
MYCSKKTRAIQAVVSGFLLTASIALSAGSCSSESETGESDDQCAEKSNDACKACCAEVHAEGQKYFDSVIRECACEEGGEKECVAQCKETFCAGKSLAESSEECKVCAGSGCGLSKLDACFENEDCKAGASCNGSCPH